MLSAGLENKAAAALPLKSPQLCGAMAPRGDWAPARLGGEPVDPKQVRPVYLIVVRPTT
jgi:hypothetical protein